MALSEKLITDDGVDDDDDDDDVDDDGDVDGDGYYVLGVKY